jgi:hypothetical protein
MPKDFDTVLPQDRSFTVRGETFQFIDVRPEVIQAWADETNGKSDESVWQYQDKQILAFLRAEDRDRYVTLRTREEDPITIAQQNALLTWLWEEATGRPTEQVSVSPSGPGKSARTSGGK